MIAVPELFAKRKPDIAPGHDGVLDALAELIKKYPTYPVQIIGYTDNRGKASELLAISAARAQAVYSALASKGVETRRLMASGLGRRRSALRQQDRAGPRQEQPRRDRLPLSLRSGAVSSRRVACGFPVTPACALLLRERRFRACGGGCGGDNGGPTGDGGIDGGLRRPTRARARPNGQACGCDGDCASGFCVDGVCCNTACTETCKSCNDQSAPGICTFVAAGARRAQPATCPTSARLDLRARRHAATALGHCRKYPAGTVCKPGTCDGAAVSDVNVCDGEGRCRPGPATICAPVQLRSGDEHLRDDLHVRHRLRQRRPVRERQLRPEAARRRLRQGQRVRVGVLRRRRLLQRRLQRAPASAATSRAATGPAGRPTPAAPIPHGICADQTRRDLRHDRRVRRHRRLRALRRRDGLHRRRPAAATG